jgi:hypothetical protein
MKLWPNVLITGPNTGTPTSTLFVEEVQVNPVYFSCIITQVHHKIGYILQLIEPVLSGHASSFTIKASPTDAYNAKVQKRISRSVFVQCYSWARTNGTGKVFNPFPWAVTLWWWWLRKPSWDHYVAVGAEKWVWARRRKTVKNILKCAAALTVLWSYINGSTQRILCDMVVSPSLFSMAIN